MRVFVSAVESVDNGSECTQCCRKHATELAHTHTNMSFRFCQDCNNMLYPREDKKENRLLFECRICNYVEQAKEARVFRHELISNIGETAGIVKDLGKDPTLPRSDKQCPNCHATRAVFFQSQQRRADTSMILFYVCLECNHTYRSV